MEENDQEPQATTETVEEDKTPEVGFPPMPQPKSKGKGNKLVLIGLGLLLLVGGGIFLFTRGAKQEQVGLSPTPTVGGIETTIPIESPTATPTSADKSKVEIEIQNGTGFAGEAAYLQGALKKLGYSDIKVGNADDQNQTVTIVTFSKSLSSTFVDEITKKLEEIYKDVETKTSSTQKVDVLIVTGLKKGVTPKPTSTATPTPTKTATPTATPSPTGT